MLHVQHLMGIGHQRRMAAIARALGANGAEVTYVSGGFAIQSLDVGAATVVQLPPARVRDARYETLLDEYDEPIDDAWRERRVRVLLDVFERSRPDTLIIESFPFARRMLSFELLPLLEAAHRRPARPLVLCSIRDILEPKTKPGRNREVVERLTRWFDGLLMHSDERITRLEDSFELAAGLSSLVHYTGYVIEKFDNTERRNAGEVLVSAGGGVVGEALLKTAADAQELMPRGTPRWRCMVGPNVPSEVFRDLKRRSNAGFVVERNRDDFPALLSRASLSVSQAGYNTVFEALSVGCRLVLVPYVEPGETEQTRRSELLASRGYACVVDPSKLSAASLADAVRRQLQQPAPNSSAIDFDGAENCVATINRLSENSR